MKSTLLKSAVAELAAGCGSLATAAPLMDHADRGQTMQNILDAYAAAANPAFIATYDDLPIEQIYAHVIDLFPQHPVQILDIGAGTGRDAAWFALRGHHVRAVEPVRELREAGQRMHPSDNIIWLDDRLPELTRLRRCAPFDFVLLGGVWQHLTDKARTIATPILAGLTARGGRLAMSLRHGEGVGGRHTFPIDTDATIAGAEACGLQLLRRREAASIQPGNKAMGVSWTWLVFEKAPEIMPHNPIVSGS